MQKAQTGWQVPPALVRPVKTTYHCRIVAVGADVLQAKDATCHPQFPAEQGSTKSRQEKEALGSIPGQAPNLRCGQNESHRLAVRPGAGIKRKLASHPGG